MSVISDLIDPTLYNLAGQKLGKSFHGVAIKNGKKYVQ